jgi:hypothetical protein|tara:strand:+ start:542 stop:841 length:300 start_codon:yes stop_codon:yes gene_type:complete
MLKYNEMTKIKTPCVDAVGSKEGRCDNGYEVTVGFTNYKIILRRQWSALYTGRKRSSIMHYQILVNGGVYTWEYQKRSGTHFSKEQALIYVNKLIEGIA